MLKRPSPLAVSKSRPRVPKAFTQCLEIQDILLRDIRHDKTPCDVRAQLARAWDVIEERKRILRMIPKPKDMEVSEFTMARALKRAKAKQLSGVFIETDATPVTEPTKEPAPLESEPKESLLPPQG